PCQPRSDHGVPRSLGARLSVPVPIWTFPGCSSQLPGPDSFLRRGSSIPTVSSYIAPNRYPAEDRRSKPHSVEPGGRFSTTRFLSSVTGQLSLTTHSHCGNATQKTLCTMSGLRLDLPRRQVRLISADIWLRAARGSGELRDIVSGASQVLEE